MLRAALGGWQVNGILNMRSGLPFNVIRNGENQVAPGLRPNSLGDPELPRGERELTRYFRDRGVQRGGPRPDAPGNAGRNILRGPGYINLDLSVFKTFRLTERPCPRRLRVEAFNLTNTPHFANPNADLSRANFGTITRHDRQPAHHAVRRQDVVLMSSQVLTLESDVRLEGEARGADAAEPSLRGEWRALLLLAVWFVAGAVAVGAHRNVPVIDDWTYAWSVERMLRDGRFEVLDWSAVFPIGHAMWGAAWSLVFGFSFATLRLSTLVLALVGERRPLLHPA